MSADLDGLGSVEASEDLFDGVRESALGDERELGVEHEPLGAAGEARRAGSQAHAALCIDRQLSGSGEALEEDEGGLSADPAAGLAALGDQAVDAGALCLERVLQGGDLGEEAPALPLSVHVREGVDPRREDDQL